MDILITLRKALSLYPNTIAVIDGPSTRLTYRELGERIARLSNALAAGGLEPGKVAAIVAPNCHQFIEAYYACAQLGAVLNPINIRLSSREMSTILAHSEATVLIAHSTCCETVSSALDVHPHQLRQVLWIDGDPTPETSTLEHLEYEVALSTESKSFPTPPPIAADTLAHLYYTSGTTGRPKGVMLTHENVTFHALAAIAELQLTDADVWLHAAPLFHLADAWATFAITWVGGTHVCLSAFDAARTLSVIDDEEITITNLIPTMLNLMVNHPTASGHSYSSLRAILSGGAPIAPETVRRIIDCFGCEYIQTYGMTETSPYLTVSILKNALKNLPPEQQLAWKSRTGRPFLGVELKVIGTDGYEVTWDDTEVGEIVAKGPIVTPGYWKDVETTAEAFTNDGWLHTGDLAVVDAEGSVNIVDRAKDTIITGGENVYSTEVEYTLYEHPDVLEAAVIGVPDEKWGEAVKAFVVPKPGTSPSDEELIAFVKERIAHYKAPKLVELIDELPKTGSGKIAKRILRERD